MDKVLAAAGCVAPRTELVAFALMVLGVCVSLGAVAVALVVVSRRLSRW